MARLNLKKEELKIYLEGVFGNKIADLKIKKIGKGVIGTGYALDFEVNKQPQRKILKNLFPKHLGNDWPADRAQSLIMAHTDYQKMDKHIRSFDVCGVGAKNQIISLGQAAEYFILMDEARGQDYFKDLLRIAQQNNCTSVDQQKVIILADYLVKLHKKKFVSESLYQRKIRDTIGSGQSIMGVLDSYPQGIKWLKKRDIEKLVQRAVTYWANDRYKNHRLSQVHGDFHPGNIWWQSDNDFVLLDRARGQYGEPADDLTALLINFIFFSMIFHSKYQGVLKDLASIFLKRYLGKTQDREVLKVMQPYFAFRAVVVCHPNFYPDSFYPKPHQANVVRRRMINFALNVLSTKIFNLNKVEQYMKKERC